MNVVLWVVAGLLAAAFLGAGLFKITGKREQMIERQAWVGDFPQTQVKGIGAIEVLGALGLILPGATGIAPVLVPIAATGLVLTMIGAAVVHLRRGDGVGQAVPSLAFAALSAFVAVGRFWVSPL